jgi:hypothetical protein
VNNTGTKEVSIMKQTAFKKEKNGEYRACLKYSVPTFNNNNNIYLLQLGCNPVAVVMLHVYKI